MRDKLVELLRMYFHNCGNSPEHPIVIIDSFADFLMEHGVTVQQWIPASERLPEEHDSMFIKLHGGEGWTTGMFRKISDEVLACVENEDGTKTVKQTHTTDGEWRLSSIRRAKVTHWMPMPEPPKEGE